MPDIGNAKGSIELIFKIEGAKSAVAALKEVETHAAKAGKNVDVMATSSEKANAKLASIGDAMGQAMPKISGVADAAKRVDDSLKGVSATASETKRSVDQLKKLKVDTSSTGEAKKALEETKKAAEQTDNVFVKMMKDAGMSDKVIKDVGDGLKAAFGVSAVAFTAVKVGEAFHDLADNAAEADAALSKLSASTGATKAQLEQYEDVMLQIKADNFGETYDELADAMGRVVQTMGKMDPTKLKKVTEAALTLEDTFGSDFNETIRGVDNMMKSFGISADEAFDLLAKGSQEGLDKTDELGDNMAEYAQVWAEMGYTAKETFKILDNGLQAGAYNLDKVNDFMKEFGISLKDGRMEDNVERFSEATQRLFRAWQNGNATTKEVFESVVTDMENMGIESTEVASLASDMWSALGEDNAIKVITALNDVNHKFDDVAGAMDEMESRRYGSLTGNLQTIGKEITGSLIKPIKDVFVPALTDATGAIADFLAMPPSTPLGEYIDGLAAEIDDLVDKIDYLERKWETTSDIGQDIETYSEYLLKAADNTETAGFDRHMVEQGLERLKNVLPEVAAAYNEETGAINMSKEAMKDLLTYQHDMSELEKNTNVAVGFHEAETEALNKKRDAAKAVLEAEAERDEARKHRWEGWDEWKEWEVARDKVTEAVEAYEEASQAYEDTAKAAKECDAEVEKQTEELEKNSLAQKANNAAREKQVSGLDAASQFIGNVLGVQVDLNKAVHDGTAYLSDHKDEIMKAIPGTKAWKEAQEEAAKAAEEAAKKQEESAKRIQKVASTIYDSYHDTYEDLKSELMDFDMSQFTADKENEWAAPESVDSSRLAYNLIEYGNYLKQYKDNMRKLQEELGEDDPFYQHLVEMGPEYSGVVQGLIDGTEDALRVAQSTYNDIFEETDQTAKQWAAEQTALAAAMGQFGSSSIDYSNLRNSVANGFAGASEAAKSKFNDLVDYCQGVGAQIPDDLALGIQAGTVSVEDATAQMQEQLYGQLEGMRQIAQDLGIALPAELATGITANSSSADMADAVASLYQTLTGANVDVQSEMEKKASEAGQGMTNGLNKEQETIKAAASANVQAALGTLTAGSVMFTMAGSANGKAYAAGLNLTEPDARRAGDSLGAAFADAMEQAILQRQEQIRLAVSSLVGSGELSEQITLETGNDAGSIGAAVGEALAKTPMKTTVNVEMQDGDVVMDGERVGRHVAPTVSRVLAQRV